MTNCVFNTDASRCKCCTCSVVHVACNFGEQSDKIISMFTFTYGDLGCCHCNCLNKTLYSLSTLEGTGAFNSPFCDTSGNDLHIWRAISIILYLTKLEPNILVAWRRGPGGPVCNGCLSSIT